MHTNVFPASHVSGRTVALSLTFAISPAIFLPHFKLRYAQGVTHVRGGAIYLAVLLFALPASGAGARQNHRPAAAQPAGDFERDAELYPEALLAASQLMSVSSIDANPHVYTTVPRSAASGDAHRAQEILEILRRSMDKYKNYRTAIADGFDPFMPKTGQKFYWFISSRNAYASAFEFNPGHPTAMLYKKSNGTYELVGAVFTAPKTATESQLNDRIPLSVARWHEHVNLCVAPKRESSQTSDFRRFGLGGSIVTQGDCAAAGGRWVSQVLGWMVTIFPFGSNSGTIWPQ
ncbi:MAG: hypothetical protein KGL02_07480 [Acidobacteriota bacterium]|nr:hypothetical protein [Acidobacteriota bacterium]MDE3171184.1 hypothetical protein [Acidobacteriota bacterium]